MTANRLSVTPSAFTTGAASHAYAMPATVNAGDLLVLRGCAFGIGGITPAEGTLIVEEEAADPRCFMVAMIADGDEGGGTWTVNFGGTPVSTGQVHRYQAGTFGDIGDIVAGTVATGSSNAPDAPLVDTGGAAADNLVTVSFHFQDDDATVNSYPANYGNEVYTPCGGAANANAAMATATRVISAASEDPGAAQLSESEGWTAYADIIPPAAFDAVLAAAVRRRREGY